MHILITGGAGFIGSHLAELLLKKRHTIFVLDDLSTGSRDNIAHLVSLPHFTFYKGSVLDESLVKWYARKTDMVFHLAAAVGVKRVMRQPLESFLVNIDGTRHLLDAAARRRIPIFIPSSSEVYGKLARRPQREDDDRLYGSVFNMRWGYALSKAVDEVLALSYARERGVKAVVGRLFNTVGPRQSSRYGMVIPTFVECALRNSPLPIYGDGRQVRCFCHVSDTVRAIAGLLRERKAYGQIFNIGSNAPITINQLAKKICTLTRSSSPVVHISQKIMMRETGDEMRARLPDISKIRRYIGWRPTVSLEQTLRQVIQEKSLLRQRRTP